jgi:predicted nucleic acid-binding protein
MTKENSKDWNACRRNLTAKSNASKRLIGSHAKNFIVVATFIDTNILLYAISTSEREAEKRSIARQILLRTDLAFSVQVFQEFYVQATRQSGARVDPEIAIRLITSWTRFPVQQTTLELLFAAFAAHRRFGISYWDAAIIEAARSLGCTEILTEDLQDHQNFVASLL